MLVVVQGWGTEVHYWRKANRQLDLFSKVQIRCKSLRRIQTKKFCNVKIPLTGLSQCKHGDHSFLSFLEVKANTFNPTPNSPGNQHDFAIHKTPSNGTKMQQPLQIIFVNKLSLGSAQSNYHRLSWVNLNFCKCILQLHLEVTRCLKFNSLFASFCMFDAGIKMILPTFSLAFLRIFVVS